MFSRLLSAVVLLATVSSATDNNVSMTLQPARVASRSIRRRSGRLTDTCTNSRTLSATRNPVCRRRIPPKITLRVSARRRATNPRANQNPSLSASSTPTSSSSPTKRVRTSAAPTKRFTNLDALMPSETSIRVPPPSSPACPWKNESVSTAYCRCFWEDPSLEWRTLFAVPFEARLCQPQHKVSHDTRTASFSINAPLCQITCPDGFQRTALGRLTLVAPFHTGDIMELWSCLMRVARPVYSFFSPSISCESYVASLANSTPGSTPCNMIEFSPSVIEDEQCGITGNDASKTTAQFPRKTSLEDLQSQYCTVSDEIVVPIIK